MRGPGGPGGAHQSGGYFGLKSRPDPADNTCRTASQVHVPGPHDVRRPDWPGEDPSPPATTHDSSTAPGNARIPRACAACALERRAFPAADRRGRGIGKTSVLTELLDDAKIWAAQVTIPRLTSAELLEDVCTRFGADAPASPSKPQILACLERHLAEIRREGIAVLVIDEAHDLSPELLEELRLLSNFESNGKPLLQIVLVGLPELETRLAQPELQQLRQRIRSKVGCSALGPEETERYLHHRVAAAGGTRPSDFPRRPVARSIG